MEDDNSTSHGYQFSRGLGKRTAVMGVMLMLLFSLVLIASASSVRADPGTTVTEDISESTVWDLDGSPYYVANDITIEEGYTLTIQAGVVVNFAPETAMFIEGTLLCKGTETNRIVMSGEDWLGLHFEEESSDSSLFGVDFSFAETAVEAENCDVEIADCTFTDCAVGLAWQSEDTLQIESCYFEDCMVAILFDAEECSLEMTDTEISGSFKGVQALNPEGLAESISIEIRESYIHDSQIGVAAVADDYLYLNICDTIFAQIQSAESDVPEALAAEMTAANGFQNLGSILAVSFGSMDAEISDCDFIQVLAGPILLDFPGACDHFNAKVTDCSFAEAELSLLCAAVVFDNEALALDSMNSFTDQIDPEFLADLSMLNTVKGVQSLSTEDETIECCEIQVNIEILNNHFLRCGPVVSATLILAFEQDWKISVNEKYCGNEFHAPVAGDACFGMPMGWFSSVLLGVFVDSESSVSHSVEMSGNDIEGGFFNGLALSGIWVTDNVLSIDSTVQRACDAKIHDNYLTGDFYDGIRAVARSADFKTCEVEGEFCVLSTLNFEVKNNEIEMSGVMGPYFEHVFEDGPAGIYVLVSNFGVKDDAKACTSGAVTICGNSVLVREESFLAEGIHVKELAHAFGDDASACVQVPISVCNNEVTTEEDALVGNGIVIERSAAAPCGKATAQICGDMNVCGNTVVANMEMDGIAVVEGAVANEGATAQVCGKIDITGNHLEASTPLVGIFVSKSAQANDEAVATVCGEVLVANNAIASPLPEAISVESSAKALDQASALISGGVSISGNTIADANQAISVSQRAESGNDASARVQSEVTISNNCIQLFHMKGVLVDRYVATSGLTDYAAICGDVTVQANRVTATDETLGYVTGIEVRAWVSGFSGGWANITQTTKIANNVIVMPGFGYDAEDHLYSYGIYVDFMIHAENNMPVEANGNAAFAGDLAITANDIKMTGGYGSGIYAKRELSTDGHGTYSVIKYCGAVLVDDNKISMDNGEAIYVETSLKGSASWFEDALQYQMSLCGDITIAGNQIVIGGGCDQEIGCDNHGIEVVFYADAYDQAKVSVCQNIVVKNNKVSVTGDASEGVEVKMDLAAYGDSTLAWRGEVSILSNMIVIKGTENDAVNVYLGAGASGAASLTVASATLVEGNQITVCGKVFAYGIYVEFLASGSDDSKLSFTDSITIKDNTVSMMVGGECIRIYDDASAYDDSCVGFESDISVVNNCVSTTSNDEESEILGIAASQYGLSADDSRLYYSGDLVVSGNTVTVAGGKSEFGISVARCAEGIQTGFVQMVGDMTLQENVVNVLSGLGIDVDQVANANVFDGDQHNERALVQLDGSIFVLNNTVKMSFGTGIEVCKEAHAYEDGVVQMCSGIVRASDNKVELCAGTGIYLNLGFEAYDNGIVQANTSVCVKGNSITIANCCPKNVGINVSLTIVSNDCRSVQLVLSASIVNNLINTHNGWGIWTNVCDAYIMDNQVTGAAFGLYDDACHQTPKPPADDGTQDGTTNPGTDPVTPSVPPVETPTNTPGAAISSAGIDAGAIALIAAFLLIAGLGALIGVRRLR